FASLRRLCGFQVGVLVVRGLCKVQDFTRSKCVLTPHKRHKSRYTGGPPPGDSRGKRRPLGGSMKRTATTLMLLAGFGGGGVRPDGGASKKSSQPGGYGTVTRPMTIPGVQGPGGEPVALTPASASGVTPGATQQAVYNRTAADAAGVQQVGFFKKGAGDCSTCAHVPGVLGDGFAGKHGGKFAGDGVGPAGGYGGGYGPDGPPPGGILPVPGMGPPGAVAAVGAIVPGMQPPAPNMRSSIRFTGPPGMKITWQLP